MWSQSAFSDVRTPLATLITAPAARGASAASRLARAVEGVEVVFHHGAVPSVPRSVAEPERTHSVNATGTLGVLEASRAAGVKRVVFASSSSAYGDTPVLPKVETLPPCPLSPYALQKYTGERYCQLYHRLYGLETVALRYFNVYGPRQNPESEYAAVIPRFATACLAGAAPVVFGDGEQTRDFTFVADAVAANLLAADAPLAPGEVVNVAGGSRIELREAIRELERLTGRTAILETATGAPGEMPHTYADIRRAADLLGWTPKTPLADGLREEIAWVERTEAAGGFSGG